MIDRNFISYFTARKTILTKLNIGIYTCKELINKYTKDLQTECRICDVLLSIYNCT